MSDPGAILQVGHQVVTEEAALMFLGLRTVIYPAPDLAAATAWFTAVLGAPLYFDAPFYVGFEVAGYELGLDPDGDLAAGPVTYWGVPDADVGLARLQAAGATVLGDGVQEVGEGIRTATVREPGGNVLGIIENPHFGRPVDGPVETPRPGS